MALSNSATTAPTVADNASAWLLGYVEGTGHSKQTGHGPMEGDKETEGDGVGSGGGIQ